MVEEVYREMGAIIPSKRTYGVEGAFLDLQQVVQAAVTLAGEAVVYCDRDVLCLLGSDGTARWHWPCQVFAVKVDGSHAASSWITVGHHFGHEKAERLRLFIEETGWEEVLAVPMEVVDYKGVTRRVRWFLCGDHMALHRLGKCDGPGSKREEMCPCPFCDTTPEVCSPLIFSGHDPSNPTPTVCFRS
jgi:hypothetical protein